VKKKDAKQSSSIAKLLEKLMTCGPIYRVMTYFALIIWLSIGCATGARAESVPQDACRDAITLNGICWRMTVPQMMQDLEGRGYNCKQTRDGFECNGNSSMVMAIEKQVFFSCEQFNACNVGFADLARAIAEQSPVAELRYKNTVFGGKYCGMGRMGDNVCVFAGNDIVRAWSDNTRSFFKKNIVMIEQGAIASGGIKLN